MKISAQDIARARDPISLDSTLDSMTDPKLIYAFCQGELLDLGYRMTEKRPRAGLLQRWSRFSTMSPGTLWVGEGFYNRPVAVRAAVLAHELRHARQIQSMSWPLFAVRYANVRWRWALEMQANRQEILAQIRMGGFDVKAKAKRMGPTFHDDYLMGRFDREDLCQKTEKLLMEWIHDYSSYAPAGSRSV